METTSVLAKHSKGKKEEDLIFGVNPQGLERLIPYLENGNFGLAFSQKHGQCNFGF